MEVKLTYRLREGSDRQRYHIETYIFVPKSLGLNSKNYSSDQFYSDTSNFLRLSAPVVPLSELSKKSAVRPWASDIKQLVDQIAEGEPGDTEAAVNGLKVLACAFKSAVQVERLLVKQSIVAAIDAEAWKKAAKKLERFVEDIDTALGRLHKIGDRSQRPGMPSEIREGWAAVDEYASLLAEEALTDLVEVANVDAESHRLGAALDAARNLAIEQYRHRRSMGWRTYAQDGEANEYLPHRWRVLKRYVSSALYLELSRDQPGGFMADIIGMAAAATAMLVATVCILLIHTVWAASLSVAFLSAMVVSYVIKDRIKELGKRHLGRRMRKNLSDHVVRIRGSEGQTLGTMKERFDVAPVGKIPNEVAELRYQEMGTQVAIEGRPENVLCHRKDIELQSDPLRAQFTGADGLTDVLRLNLHPLMVRMDDEIELYRYVHPETLEIEETRCARVYNVHVVFRFTSSEGDIRTQIRRVVLNESGILRVEEPSIEEEVADHLPNVKTQRQIRIFDD